MCNVKQQSKCGKSIGDMRAINRHCLLFLENILYTEQAKHSSNSWRCTDQYQHYNGLKKTLIDKYARTCKFYSAILSDDKY